MPLIFTEPASYAITVLDENSTDPSVRPPFRSNAKFQYHSEENRSKQWVLWQKGTVDEGLKHIDTLLRSFGLRIPHLHEDILVQTIIAKGIKGQVPVDYVKYELHRHFTQLRMSPITAEAWVYKMLSGAFSPSNYFNDFYPPHTDGMVYFRFTPESEPERLIYPIPLDVWCVDLSSALLLLEYGTNFDITGIYSSEFQRKRALTKLKRLATPQTLGFYTGLFARDRSFSNRAILPFIIDRKHIPERRSNNKITLDMVVDQRIIRAIIDDNIAFLGKILELGRYPQQLFEYLAGYLGFLEYRKEYTYPFDYLTLDNFKNPGKIFQQEKPLDRVRTYSGEFYTDLISGRFLRNDYHSLRRQELELLFTNSLISILENGDVVDSLVLYATLLYHFGNTQVIDVTPKSKNEILRLLQSGTASNIETLINRANQILNESSINYNYYDSWTIQRARNKGWKIRSEKKGQRMMYQLQTPTR